MFLLLRCNPIRSVSRADSIPIIFHYSRETYSRAFRPKNKLHRADELGTIGFSQSGGYDAGSLVKDAGFRRDRVLTIFRWKDTTNRLGEESEIFILFSFLFFAPFIILSMGGSPRRNERHFRGTGHECAAAVKYRSPNVCLVKCFQESDALARGLHNCRPRSRNGCAY